ncbi:MAG: hypothetical protein EXR69_02875 [Myxococcales bacterium]|nr:hypothetical protein [Myxococcales bacterium]
MLRGLTEVPSGGLKALLGHAYRGEVEFPLTVTELTRTGLQYCAVELLAHLRALPREAVISVVTAVIAEREAAAREAAGRLHEAAARSAAELRSDPEDP